MKSSFLRMLGALMFAVVLLAGCSAVPVAKDGEPLKENEGLLAFHVTSNADARLSYLDFANETTFASRFGENMVGPKGAFFIRAGETYYLVPMAAGEYMWSKFDVYPRFAWLQGNNRFKVRPKTITYIGHLRINVVDQRFGLQAFDRELDMRTRLVNTYPAYFESLNFEKSIAELRLR